MVGARRGRPRFVPRARRGWVGTSPSAPPPAEGVTARYGTGIYGTDFYGQDVAALPTAVVLPGQEKPSLDLHAEIVTAGGTRYRWSAHDRDPADIPQGIGFTTKRYEGFSTGGCQLSRPIDRDFPDLNLYDGFNLIGYDGSVAYEGRLSAQPRSTPFQIEVQSQGWMAHARDRKFRYPYVDRDLSNWQGPSVQRRANLLTANYTPGDPQVLTDPSVKQPALVTQQEGPWTSTSTPAIEGWYDSQGVPLGSIYYAWKRGSTIGTPGAWQWTCVLSSDDVLTAQDSSGDLDSAGPGTGTVTATANRYFARVLLTRDPPDTSGSDNAVYPIFWTVLAVYGDHGLTKRGTADATNAQGFYASDVIRHIVSTWCPKLNANGVQDTTHVIPQIAFRERIDPYDAFLLLNGPHLWELEVWENRTLYYRPPDFTDYQWQVGRTDPGVSVQFQGDSAEDLANGIVVQFNNLRTGQQDEVSPETHSELADPDVEHPANRHGLEAWTEISLSIPADEETAVQIGRAVLAEFNAPKAPGTITVRGHLKDRAGHYQQAWKVRAGQTISITDYPNDRPRMITETAWDHEAKTLTISLDSTRRTVDAFIDRIETALRSRNLAT